MAKICILRHSYYPQETHVRRDAETLVKKGNQVTIVCLRLADQTPYEVVSGVEVYRMPVQHHRRGVLRYIFEYSASFFCALILLAKLNWQKRFDVIEVDGMPDFLVFSTLIPRWTGTRIVLYLFEAMPEEFIQKYGVPSDHWMVKALAWVEQRAIQYADHVVTACEAFRTAFVGRGAQKEKITVVLNVPNDDLFRSAWAAHTPKKDKTGFTLITHGTLIEIYGVQNIIKAVAHLKSTIPFLKLQVVGGGEYLPELKRLARELEVEDHVEFIYWVPQPEVVKMILDADVGMVSILRGYGDMMVPTKLFEFIALHKPVICSSLKGIRDYFDESALLFFEPDNELELADRIFQLYQNPQMGMEMTQRAAQIYEQHRWDKSQDIYQNVIASTLAAS
ncbi:MAG TPA: glycosyltransferase family 4 protein [Anaerolineales bacterium]|nr:glycosyltransferase family 4 protein [Anaerolineales bacterium]